MGEGEGSDFPPKKAQLDEPAACSSTMEAPATKKLARQLDFMAFDSNGSALWFCRNTRRSLNVFFFFKLKKKNHMQNDVV